MGLYRDETGLVIETDDAFARSHGYTPVSPEERGADIASQAEASPYVEDRGALGTLNAGLTGLASGLSLGGTDYLLGKGLGDPERERLQHEIHSHPYVRTGGEVAGMVLGSFEGVGGTPSGYLSSLANHQVENGLAQEGFRGTAKALSAMGAESAIQNAGQYIGHSALEDTEVTTEGLTGALGTGFAYGVAGGGAVLGVSKGTIAARRLYSRFMDGGPEAVKAAETTWSLASQEALDADAATARIAKQRLEDIKASKAEALRYKQEAAAATEEERIRAAGYQAPEPFKTEAPELMRTEGGTQIIPRPGKLDEAVPVSGTAVPNEGTPPSSPDATQVIPGMKSGAGESVKPDFTVEPSGKQKPMPIVTQPGEDLALAHQAGQDIAAGRAASAAEAARGGENSIKTWLDDVAEHDASAKPLSAAHKETSLEAKLAETRDRVQAGESFKSMRERHTAELLGSGIADDESKLAEAVAEFEAAHNELMTRVFDVTGGKTGKVGLDVPLDFARLEPGRSGVQVPAAHEDILALRNEGRAQEGTAVGKRAAMLDAAHEDALIRASKASDPKAIGEALREADDIEHDLRYLSASGSHDVPTDFLSDVAEKAGVFQRYEKASAKLTEAVGEQAHPVSVAHAEAYAKAESESARKVTDRATRAIEDQETFGPHEFVGPKYKEPKERVLYARERQLEAKRSYEKVSADEATAKDQYSAARQKLADGEKAKKAALKVDAKTAKETERAANQPSRFDQLLKVAGIDETLGIPGLPKPSDLPVVGPLLGAWLKYRTIKAAMGRGAGRVLATGDAKVATLAARTKDRIARAIDHSLTGIEKGSAKAVKYAPTVTGAIGRRIFDDGKPDVKPTASVQEKVARRSEELAAYVTTPNAIENDVRRQLADVTDPDIIASAEQARRMMMEYLLKYAPKAPDLGLGNKTKVLPSPAEAMSFARRMDAANDPAGVYERLAQANAHVSIEGAQTVQDLYPQLFMMGAQRALMNVAKQQESLPYAQRVRLTFMYGLPLDSSLDPDNLKITQAAFEKKPAAQPPMPTAAPTPSIAGPVDLTALYQNTFDRQR